MLRNIMISVCLLQFAAQIILTFRAEFSAPYLFLLIFPMPAFVFSITSAITAGAKASWHFLSFGVSLITQTSVSAALLHKEFDMAFPGGEDPIFMVMVLSAIVSSIYFIAYFVPTALLPRLRGSKYIGRPADASLKPTKLPIEVFVRIRSAFGAAEAAVRTESKNLEDAVRAFEKTMVEREKQLALASQAMQQAQQEAEAYREIASLTKAQQKAFLRLLHKSKYTDYGVGFVLGVAGSALVEAGKGLLFATSK